VGRLSGRIACVTGASRGVGRGIAVALGAEGATVYVTGRTLTEGAAALPGTITSTAEAVTKAGGRGVAMQCDHSVDADVRRLFERIEAESGRLDVLVNNVFCVSEEMLDPRPFWLQPLSLWDEQHTVGLRSHYVASVLAMPLLLKSQCGLIANISSFGGAGYQLNVPYGVCKAGVDRLAADMAKDCKPHGITSVSLYPGIVRTERIVAMGDDVPFPMENTESAEFTGRAIAALSADPERLRHTGKTLIVAELAQDYAFTDTDGRTPASLRRSPKS